MYYITSSARIRHMVTPLYTVCCSIFFHMQWFLGKVTIEFSMSMCLLFPVMKITRSKRKPYKTYILFVCKLLSVQLSVTCYQSFYSKLLTVSLLSVNCYQSSLTTNYSLSIANTTRFCMPSEFHSKKPHPPSEFQDTTCRICTDTFWNLKNVM